MDLITIILIAVGLSMDAVAVSVCLGGTSAKINFQRALTVALWFGTFQAIMPIIGWGVGATLKDLIANIDHWVVFLILSLIGIRMIYESFYGKSKVVSADPFNLGVLALLSLATSIDALAVGISFAFINIPIINPIIIIGIVTFMLSLIGAYIGKRIGLLFAKRIEVIGGLILIAIGAKILIEHLGLI